MARRRTYPKPVSTADERAALEAFQGGACAICGEVTELHLDHSYRTGKTRGLLCRTCNTALGMFKDFPTRLKKALAYLKHPPMKERT
jgi:Recombination endonuclease VII